MIFITVDKLAIFTLKIQYAQHWNADKTKYLL